GALLDGGLRVTARPDRRAGSGRSYLPRRLRAVTGRAGGPPGPSDAGRATRLGRLVHDALPRELLLEDAVALLAAQPLLGGVRDRHGGQEPARVVVLRRPQDLVARALLDDLALVHDGDPARQDLDD